MQGLGLDAVQYFNGLMPLLLDMMGSTDQDIQRGALSALAALVKATWPRMKSHAVPIRNALTQVTCSFSGKSMPNSTLFAEVTTVGNKVNDFAAWLSTIVSFCLLHTSSLQLSQFTLLNLWSQYNSQAYNAYMTRLTCLKLKFLQYA
jgi:hypothetical protein